MSICSICLEQKDSFRPFICTEAIICKECVEDGEGIEECPVCGKKEFHIGEFNESPNDLDLVKKAETVLQTQKRTLEIFLEKKKILFQEAKKMEDKIVEQIRLCREKTETHLQALEKLQRVFVAEAEVDVSIARRSHFRSETTITQLRDRLVVHPDLKLDKLEIKYPDIFEPDPNHNPFLQEKLSTLNDLLMVENYLPENLGDINEHGPIATFKGAIGDTIYRDRTSNDQIEFQGKRFGNNLPIPPLTEDVELPLYVNGVLVSKTISIKTNGKGPVLTGYGGEDTLFMPADDFAENYFLHNGILQCISIQNPCVIRDRNIRLMSSSLIISEDSISNWSDGRVPFRHPLPFPMGDIIGGVKIYAKGGTVLATNDSIWIYHNIWKQYPIKIKRFIDCSSSFFCGVEFEYQKIGLLNILGEIVWQGTISQSYVDIAFHRMAIIILTETHLVFLNAFGEELNRMLIKEPCVKLRISGSRVNILSQDRRQIFHYS